MYIFQVYYNENVLRLQRHFFPSKEFLKRVGRAFPGGLVMTPGFH